MFLSLLSINSNKDKIWNYHCCLGHPAFKILERMFHSLFKNIDVEFFHCEACEFAKHHRVPFPLNNTISLSPFSLIHSDIWGPSRISNTLGAKGFVTFIEDCT